MHYLLWRLTSKTKLLTKGHTWHLGKYVIWQTKGQTRQCNSLWGSFPSRTIKNIVLFTVDVDILNGELNSNETDPAIENITLTILLLKMLCLIRDHQSLFLYFAWLPPAILMPQHSYQIKNIYVVHSPTNALFINLVKSFKFTLKYTITSLLHVSVFNDHCHGALSVPI